MVVVVAAADVICAVVVAAAVEAVVTARNVTNVTNLDILHVRAMRRPTGVIVAMALVILLGLAVNRLMNQVATTATKLAIWHATVLIKILTVVTYPVIIATKADIFLVIVQTAQSHVISVAK